MNFFLFFCQRSVKRFFYILFIVLWPLFSFLFSGQSEIVKYLLSRGVDVNALSVIGTPLALAGHKGHATIVKILLQHNADVMFKSSLICWLSTSLLTYGSFLLRSQIVPTCIWGHYRLVANHAAPKVRQVRFCLLSALVARIILLSSHITWLTNACRVPFGHYGRP